MPNTIQRMITEARERAAEPLEETPTRAGERFADAGEPTQVAQSRAVRQVEGARARGRGATGRQWAAFRARRGPRPAGHLAGAPEGEAGLIPVVTEIATGEPLGPADRAAVAAARAERASERASAAADQMIAALNRIASLQTRSQAQVTGPKGRPTDVEIRVGEAVESPLMRAADAVTRAIIAAGETVYDYSDGHYGRTPMQATDIRHEREKERERAQPVAIIEGHYEPASEKKRGRALPLAIVVAVAVAAIAALVFSQRRRIQQLVTRRAPTQPWEPTGPLSPTPTFERVIRGELLSRLGGATTGTSVGGTTPAPGAAPTSPGSATGTYGRDIDADESGDSASPRT